MAVSGRDVSIDALATHFKTSNRVSESKNTVKLYFETSKLQVEFEITDKKGEPCTYWLAPDEALEFESAVEEPQTNERTFKKYNLCSWAVRSNCSEIKMRPVERFLQIINGHWPSKGKLKFQSGNLLIKPDSSMKVSQQEQELIDMFVSEALEHNQCNLAFNINGHATSLLSAFAIFAYWVFDALELKLEPVGCNVGCNDKSDDTDCNDGVDLGQLESQVKSLARSLQNTLIGQEPSELPVNGYFLSVFLMMELGRSMNAEKANLVHFKTKHIEPLILGKNILSFKLSLLEQQMNEAGFIPKDGSGSTEMSSQKPSPSSPSPTPQKPSASPSASPSSSPSSPSSSPTGDDDSALLEMANKFMQCSKVISASKSEILQLKNELMKAKLEADNLGKKFETMIQMLEPFSDIFFEIIVFQRNLKIREFHVMQS